MHTLTLAELRKSPQSSGSYNFEIFAFPPRFLLKEKTSFLSNFLCKVLLQSWVRTCANYELGRLEILCVFPVNKAVGSFGVREDALYNLVSIYSRERVTLVPVLV